uniref:Uncharacterized protein n=1 Tax=Plectus sambesii TaxID=2011161 RepID=A0A914UKX3_9BILA
LTGILMFFVIPITRQAPLGLARILGNKTAKYRWFALVYVAVMFFLLPGAIFALSMAGETVLMMVGAPLCIVLLLVIVINALQVYLPSVLPSFLRDWEWLPRWMHSLEPADALIVRLSSALPFCTSCCPADKSLVLGPDDHRSESRHRLLMTATCTPVASVPSRLSSRAASPSRFRDTLPNRTVPDTAV